MKDIFYKKLLQILFVINTICYCYAAPEVSVIIPIYNTEKDFLIQCLDSVTKQTLSNIEIICVNDGSTNIDTINILDNYAKEDPRIIVLKQENQGISSARNKGLDIARAEYVLFVDSDDYIHPQMLEIMTVLAKNGDVDVVMCPYQEVGNVPSDFFKKYEMPKCDVMYDLNPIISWAGPFHHIWNKLYTKSAISDIRFSDEAFSCEDVEFNLRLFSKNIRSYKLIDIPFYYYRVDNVSVVRSLLTKRRMKALHYLTEKIWEENNALLSIDKKYDFLRKTVIGAMNGALYYSNFNVFLYAAHNINDLYSRGIINFNILEKASDKMKLAIFVYIGKMRSAWLSIKNLLCNSNDIKE